VSVDDALFPEVIFPIGKHSIGIRMTNTQHQEDIEQSFVYIIKTKDFNKSIVKIPFPKE
jgi:hypothetical protein